MASRMDRLLQALPSLEVDGLITRRPSHIAYLLGLQASAGILVLLEDDITLIVDPRYHTQASEKVSGAKIVLARRSLDEALQSVLKKRLGSPSPKRLGFEGDDVSVVWKRRVDSWELPCAWVELRDPVGDLRVVKSSREIALLEENFRIAQTAYDEAVPTIRPGATECEAAALLESRLRIGGAECYSFDTIAAAGERSALPHSLPGQRRWHQGEPLLLDFGLRRQGYCTDLTRMLGVDKGKPSRIAAIVREARQAALETIRPGISGSKVDAAARGWIKKKGYGDLFGHGTGHGIGLDIHERPRISRLRSEKLREGMVFTLEPGIYLPGEFGVRLEDVVRVTSDGFAFVSDPAR